MKPQFETYHPFSSSPEIKYDFTQYINETPNKKHISPEDKASLVEWLSNPTAKPMCQKDYSRRNYAQKTYKLDATHGTLWEIAKNGKVMDRMVITEDKILKVVEQVHMVEHGGWDATWEQVSRQYCGIVRSDVIFLLKRCEFCQSDPRKRAKGSQAPAPAPGVCLPTPPTEQKPETYYPHDENNQTQDRQEGGDFWKDGMTGIDPLLLMSVQELPFYGDYPPGEASGSNDFPYGYNGGQ